MLSLAIHVDREERYKGLKQNYHFKHVFKVDKQMSLLDLAYDSSLLIDVSLRCYTSFQLCL